jgi:D-alanyl-D-alanine carboxypeptidase
MSSTTEIASGVPPFASRVTTVTSADVASSYHAGCPVGPAHLRELHMSFWGFDNQPHTGTMIVNAAVMSSALTVFASLYAQRFPIRRMEPVEAFRGSDPASMAADNTSGFNCRDAVAPGAPRWSVHAYGEAIDVNTVENPYVEGGTVQPAAGAAFLVRSDHRPGMAYPGAVLVSAFAAVGWRWGGRWSDPDYQHFSATGG